MWPPTRAVIAKWGLIALLVASALAYLRFVPPSSPWSPRNIVGAIMPEPTVITKIEKVVVPGPERIRVITKEKIVKVYKDLPTPATEADNTAQVIAVADIPVSPAGGTALAVIKPGSDNVSVGYIEYKPKKVPFFQIQKIFGARIGMGTGGMALGELYAQPLRIGPVTVEARAYGKRDDRSGADFGGIILADYRF